MIVHLFLAYATKNPSFCDLHPSPWMPWMGLMVRFGVIARLSASKLCLSLSVHHWSIFLLTYFMSSNTTDSLLHNFSWLCPAAQNENNCDLVTAIVPIIPPFSWSLKARSTYPSKCSIFDHQCGQKLRKSWSWKILPLRVDYHRRFRRYQPQQWWSLGCRWDHFDYAVPRLPLSYETRNARVSVGNDSVLTSRDKFLSS